jgi:hypothetical protein
LNVPAIEINNSDLSIGGGRGFGGGLGQLGGAVADSLRISFFNIESGTDRDLFVIDMSGSMVFEERGIKGFETVVDEFVATLEKMKGVGTFNLIAFSGKVDKFEESGFLPVDGRSIRRAQEWLMDRDPAKASGGKPITGAAIFRSYKGGRHLGTNANLALTKAFEYNPEAIIFLSDGEPTPDANEALKTAKGLLANTKIPINTVSYKSKNGREFLKKLAKLSGGTYTAKN